MTGGRGAVTTGMATGEQYRPPPSTPGINGSSPLVRECRFGNGPYP
ncbi:hypothetical protein [Chitinophaga sp. OAE865]